MMAAGGTASANWQMVPVDTPVSNQAFNASTAPMPATVPPAAPSQVFFGLIFGAILCRADKPTNGVGAGIDREGRKEAEEEPRAALFEIADEDEGSQQDPQIDHAPRVDSVGLARTDGVRRQVAQEPEQSGEGEPAPHQAGVHMGAGHHYRANDEGRQLREHLADRHRRDEPAVDKLHGGQEPNPGNDQGKRPAPNPGDASDERQADGGGEEAKLEVGHASQA